MKNMGLVLLLGCMLLQIGCAGSHSPMGLVVCVTDTIDGQQYIISARVEEDGKFANSISKGNRTQTMSGQVTKSGDKYIVAIDCNYVKTNGPINEVKQIKTRVELQEGQLQEIGGLGNGVTHGVTRIRISSE
jgi:hypothetical protein